MSVMCGSAADPSLKPVPCAEGPVLRALLRPELRCRTVGADSCAQPKKETREDKLRKTTSGNTFVLSPQQVQLLKIMEKREEINLCTSCTMVNKTQFELYSDIYLGMRQGVYFSVALKGKIIQSPSFVSLKA